MKTQQNKQLKNYSNKLFVPHIHTGMYKLNIKVSLVLVCLHHTYMYLQYKTVSFELKVYILHCLFIHILRIKSTQMKFNKKKMFSSHFVDMQYAYTVKFTD